MSRSIALANLIQAAIYAYGAHWLGSRWGLPAAIMIGAAAAQIVAAVGVWLNRERLVRLCAIACLVGCAVLIGQFLAAGEHLAEAYGSDARKIGERSQVAVLMAIPWAVGFPLYQALRGGMKGLTAPAVALFLPILWGALHDAPDRSWPAQPDLEAAAQAAFSRWTASDTGAAIPSGVGPATILLTPFADGRPGKTVRGNGADLGAAITEALRRVAPPEQRRPALVVDLARAAYPVGAAIAAGDGGGLSKKGGTSPTVAWRPGKVGSKQVAPQWTLPRPKIGKQSPTRFDSVLVDANGAYALSGAWTAPPELSAETALEAALAGGRMLARHQTEAGRYAYTVRGPSGKRQKKGYNFPRHAGTTWFMARLAARTGDPEIVEATNKGLAYIAANTNEIGDGRSYFADKRRRDGKAWAGTTALAALAATVAGHELAAPYGRFLASTIDEHGQVLGEMDRKTAVFPAQKKNPYGQGQVVLALAALVRDGHDSLTDALKRSAAYMDGDYAPGGAGRLVVLDEHWTCIAALAIRDVLGTAHGMEVCEAYLASKASSTPDAGSRIRPHGGAAGGLAEAVVAAAVLAPDGPYHADALAFGQWFLRNAYNAPDAALLPRPRALLGGFRDTPYRLDVRMDAVQHIGCALLGVEALLGEALPGTLP